jgi:methylene-fatty-acyl-phospholipid synthase
MDALSQYINFKEPTLWYSLAFILFNPTFWNVVGRAEYHTRMIRKAFCGNKYFAIYFFAVVIFSLGIARDWVYHMALDHQPKIDLPFDNDYAKIAAVPLFIAGAVLVFGAYYRLGIDGTYLGDYFGVLKKERITGFPFNVNDDPMYLGSSLSFLAHGIWNRSPAGIMISVYVFVVYKIYSILLEGPFTAHIYSEAAKRAQVNAQKKAKKAN